MTTRKTKEEQRQIEQEKDEKRLAKEEQKKEERDAKFMSHFRQVDNTSHDNSDRYTQLEHVLGNIHKFTDRQILFLRNTYKLRMLLEML